MVPFRSRKTKSHPAIEVIGWYGTIAIISALFLVSFSLISPSRLLFPLLNFTGALALATETFFKKDYQPFWLNCVCLLIAAGAIVNILLRSR